MYMPEKSVQPHSNREQNFYHLACIQSVSIGPAAVIIGKQLLEQHGAGAAICSILVGNLILWVIGLSIISMVYHAQTNAIENIRGYLGSYGGLLFAIILMLAFLSWYAIEIKSTVKEVSTLFHPDSSRNASGIIRIGATLGILTSLLAIGGIRLLKWVTSIGFPIMILYSIYAILTSNYSIKTLELDLSFQAIISTVLLLLPGVINLPTFFRHSRSKPNSFLALTIMTVSITFFECVSIWMSFSGNGDFIITNPVSTNMSAFIIFTAFFLVLTSICSNLLNIYLASACYETFIPRLTGTKGHAIIGLMGTAVYTFIQISSPVQFLANLFNCYIGVMGIVLLIGILSQLIIKHRPRKFERTINMAAWLIGCLVATALMTNNPDQVVHTLLLSMAASTLFFICVFFIEETNWAIRKLKSQHIDHHSKYQ